MKLLTETEKGYIAGIVDGEGCFTFNKQAGYTPRLLINMTSRDTVSYLHSLLGGGFGTHPHLNHKTSYMLTVSANTLRELLPQILPLLKTKRSQARLIQEFLSGAIRGRPSPGKRLGYLAWRDALVSEVFDINQEN